MKDIISKINKVFENKIRLGIMAALIVNKKLDFNQLKKLMDVTDGNLSSNITVLEKSGFIEVTKTFINKKTNTSFEITEKGRKSFMEHLNALEDIIRETKK
jgi:DNA-binding HxlR family transcriptional regulator